MMSDLVGLVAISLLQLVAFFLVAYLGRLANDLSTQIATGVARGTAISPALREGILFNTWLPAEVLIVDINALPASRSTRHNIDYRAIGPSP
jgi:hypothetical protein